MVTITIFVVVCVAYIEWFNWKLKRLMKQRDIELQRKWGVK